MSVQYDTNRELMERLDADRKMVRDAKKHQIAMTKDGIKREKNLVRAAKEHKDETEEDIRHYGWTRGNPERRMKEADWDLNWTEKQLRKSEDKLERLRGRNFL